MRRTIKKTTKKTKQITKIKNEQKQAKQNITGGGDAKQPKIAKGSNNTHPNSSPSLANSVLVYNTPRFPTQPHIASAEPIYLAAEL